MRNVVPLPRWPVCLRAQPPVEMMRRATGELPWRIDDVRQEERIPRCSAVVPRRAGPVPSGSVIEAAVRSLSRAAMAPANTRRDRRRSVPYRLRQGSNRSRGTTTPIPRMAPGGLRCLICVKRSSSATATTAPSCTRHADESWNGALMSSVFTEAHTLAGTRRRSGLCAARVISKLRVSDSSAATTLPVQCSQGSDGDRAGTRFSGSTCSHAVRPRRIA